MVGVSSAIFPTPCTQPLLGNGALEKYTNLSINGNCSLGEIARQANNPLREAFSPLVDNIRGLLESTSHILVNMFPQEDQYGTYFHLTGSSIAVSSLIFPILHFVIFSFDALTAQLCRLRDWLRRVLRITKRLYYWRRRSRTAKDFLHKRDFEVGSSMGLRRTIAQNSKSQIYASQHTLGDQRQTGKVRI